MQLKAKINSKAKELNVPPQIMFQNYMMECFLERLSKSEYADRFIIKGGVLISSIVGLNNRTTMDITTGDSIYPEAILYGFNKVFENQKISLYSYPIETILAEKLETILSRNITTTRPRDFYDVYVLNAKSINQKNLKTALENTCKHRESEKVLKQIPEIILTIKDSENLKEQWKKYSKKMPYAADISFEQVVEKIEDLLNLITDGEKK